MRSGDCSTIGSMAVTHKFPAVFHVATDRLAHFLAVPGQIPREVPLLPWADADKALPQNPGQSI